MQRQDDLMQQHEHSTCLEPCQPSAEKGSSVWNRPFDFGIGFQSIDVSKWLGHDFHQGHHSYSSKAVFRDSRRIRGGVKGLFPRVACLWSRPAECAIVSPSELLFITVTLDYL